MAILMAVAIAATAAWRVVSAAAAALERAASAAVRWVLGNAIARRVAIALALTVGADIVAWQAESGVGVYVQHLFRVAWPILREALIASTG